MCKVRFLDLKNMFVEVDSKRQYHRLRLLQAYKPLQHPIHTFLDVNIFLDANFNLNTLGSNYTDNQVFRIAILPAEYGTSNLGMNELMNNLNIEDSDIYTLYN